MIETNSGNDSDAIEARASAPAAERANATAPELPYAHGGPPLVGRMRTTPEDFEVEELLGFEPTGAGEHVFLRVEKRGANTQFVARELARFAGVQDVAI